jgi:thiol:disulfide interchange protein DsbC
MLKHWLCAALLAIVGSHAVAAQSDKAARDALQKVLPNGKISMMAASDLPGFYQAIIDSQVFYVTADGKYLIHGSVFDIDKHRDIGESQLAAWRKGTLTKIPANQEIVFAPPNPKYTVTVFTDVDCPYCRQFHKQIAEYNKLGIAVKYVLFPLPMHPGADKKAQTVWCSNDRNVAYTDAMNGKFDVPRAAPSQAKLDVAQALKATTSGAAAPQVASAGDSAKAAEAGAPPAAPAPLTCANPLTELTNIGKSMGVDGTPAVFTDDGNQVGGYLAPDKLVQRLDQLSQVSRGLSSK